MSETFYRASRLVALLEPPAGEDFNPDRDAKYAVRDTSVRSEAFDFASFDINECGRVEERIKNKRHPSQSDVVSVWSVFPDGSSERTAE